MSKLLEFLLGSVLIAIFTLAFLFFSALHYIVRAGSVSDCLWQGSAQTWIDSDGDGLLDPGEPPLGGVEIHVDGIENELFDISWPAVTGRDGDVQLRLAIPGCADDRFELRVNIPDGYRLTTRPRIEVHPDLSGARRTYYFGFMSER